MYAHMFRVHGFVSERVKEYKCACCESSWGYIELAFQTFDEDTHRRRNEYFQLCWICYKLACLTDEDNGIFETWDRDQADKIYNNIKLMTGNKGPTHYYE